MKPLFWAMAIALLIVYFSGCASLNEWAAKMDERTYNRYTNQALVKWYRKQFLPKMNELSKNSSYGMYIVEKVNQEFLGVKIDYTEEMNYSYHDDYAPVHNNTLNWYKQYPTTRWFDSRI